MLGGAGGRVLANGRDDETASTIRSVSASCENPGTLACVRRRLVAMRVIAHADAAYKSAGRVAKQRSSDAPSLGE
jgi:hypothetical protein